MIVVLCLEICYYPESCKDVQQLVIRSLHGYKLQCKHISFPLLFYLFFGKRGSNLNRK